MKSFFYLFPILVLLACTSTRNSNSQLQVKDTVYLYSSPAVAYSSESLAGEEYLRALSEDSIISQLNRCLISHLLAKGIQVLRIDDEIKPSNDRSFYLKVSNLHFVQIRKLETIQKKVNNEIQQANFELQGLRIYANAQLLSQTAQKALLENSSTQLESYSDGDISEQPSVIAAVSNNKLKKTVFFGRRIPMEPISTSKKLLNDVAKQMANQVEWNLRYYQKHDHTFENLNPSITKPDTVKEYGPRR
jgi:hypothetical protein